MKLDALGAKASPPASPIDQIVVPSAGSPSSPTQRNAAPPHSWTSTPRWRRYQSRSATGSRALKKMPPMPVTRFMARSSPGKSKVRKEGRRVGAVVDAVDVGDRQARQLLLGDVGKAAEVHADHAADGRVVADAE